MLVVNFEIAEGEYKGYYMDKYKNSIPKIDTDSIKWAGKYYLMLEGDKWQERFKGFITSIEESNEGFKWNAEVGDEQSLKGKLFGGVFGEEEFVYNGEIKTNSRLRLIRSTKAIREGNFNIPKKKEVSSEAVDAVFDNNFVPTNDPNLPF